MKLTLGSLTIDTDKVSSTLRVGARILRIHFKTSHTIDVICGVIEVKPCLICYTGTNAELKMLIDRCITR